MNKLDVSVVLPTYNESENLPIIIPLIVDELQKAGINGEVIVVDDNSPDGTAAVSEKLGNQYPVRTILRTTDRGLAKAVIAGFEDSEATVCIVMDADISHPVEKLPEMIRPILDDNADITVGSRHTEGGGIGKWALHRQIVSKTAAMMTLGLTQIKDPTSGVMGVRRSILGDIPFDPVGWKIVLETVVKAKDARVEEVPIEFNERIHGESKMSLKEQWNYIVHLYKLHKFKHQTYIEFLKFCIVGFSGIFVDMGVVVALKETLTIDTRLAAAFGFIAAVTTNFLLNRQWSFEGAKNVPFVRSYLIFVAVASLGFAVRLGVMHLLITYADMDTGYRYALTNFIGILIATVVNFFGSKYFAFSPERFLPKAPTK